MTKKTDNAVDSNIEKTISGSDAAMLDTSIDGVFSHTFSRPVDFDGNTYDSLDFDFGKLTGGDSLSVEDELRAAGHPVIVRSVDGDYLIRMCAKACLQEIDHDIFKHMPVKDYIYITNISKRFL